MLRRLTLALLLCCTACTPVRTVYDEQGNVLAIGRWYGQNYTVPALKAAMVGTVDHRLYVKDPADATKFLAITADDVEFTYNTIIKKSIQLPMDFR